MPHTDTRDQLRHRPLGRRTTDREFREITRRLRWRSPVDRRWRSTPTDARDRRFTPHGDRRSVPTVAVATGALVLAVVALTVMGDARLAIAMALVGSAGAALLGADQARTHVTVTDDGRVEIGNGVLRRTTCLPAVTVARVTLPYRHGSRWDPRRPAGELRLRTGECVPVRALGYDPSAETDHTRAALLARTVVRACEDAGAVLETRKV